MNRPQGWTLTEQGGRVVCAAPDQRTLVSLEAVIGRSEEEILKRLVVAGKLGPLQNLTAIQSKGAELKFQGQYQGQRLEGRAMLAMRGGIGTLYVAAAAPGQLARQLPQLVEMLESVRLGGNSGLKFQLYTEARERAFTTELPVGWRTELGLFRAGALDNRTETSAVTDGATIFIGDRNLGNYIVPTQFMASLGFREGSMYNPSGISASMLMRYLPGAQAAQYWINGRLPGARVLGQRDRADLAQQVAQQRYRYGNVMRATLHAGELDFEYQGQRGQAVAITEVYPSGDTYSWNVTSIFGYFARAERSAEAAAALGHALGTWRVDLEWLVRERKMAIQEAKAALETMNYVNDVFRSTMAQRAASSDQRARVNGDLLSGTFRVVDPVTGETGTVEAGANYYYRVLDPNHPPEPVNLRRLLRVDWD